MLKNASGQSWAKTGIGPRRVGLRLCGAHARKSALFAAGKRRIALTDKTCHRQLLFSRLVPGHAYNLCVRPENCSQNSFLLFAETAKSPKETFMDIAEQTVEFRVFQQTGRVSVQRDWVTTKLHIARCAPSLNVLHIETRVRILAY